MPLIEKLQESFEDKLSVYRMHVYRNVPKAPYTYSAWSLAWVSRNPVSCRTKVLPLPVRG